jgi:hypothetical protein
VSADANGNWSDAAFTAKLGQDRSLAISGQLPGLKSELIGSIHPGAPNQLQISVLLGGSQNASGAYGAGIVWEFVLDSPAFGGRLPEPELLDGRSGWKWPVGREEFVTVRSDRPLARVYFENNQKNAIRTVFSSSRGSSGSGRVRLTITLPEGGRQVPSPVERYGPTNVRSWYRGALDWNAAPVNLRFLNRDDRPAGRHGVVKAVGDRLVFADGTPARFWGASLGATALFSTPKQNIARQARRIAELGYNLIRLNHHDSDWVNPNVFNRVYDDTRHLDAKSLDMLDWWIKCLKDEGVYIWLSMHEGRILHAGDGVSQGRAEIMRGGGHFEGLHYYNPELHQLMVEFQRAYLNHVNRYTGLAYKDDPAVAFILITNEDDLTHHFGILMLPDKNNPAHNALFTKDYKAFAQDHGLPPERVFQTWEPGPGKLYLNDVEHQFNLRMIAGLRGLGARAAIVTTNFWGLTALYSLPALTDGDVIDVHSYGGGEALSVNPRYVANYISWMAAAQVYGKPMTVSEWNVQYPIIDRFTGPLYVASMAALQGWNMVMIYNYSQVSLQPPARDDVWSTFFDPALCGVMPAAALAYRQGHISPARTTFCLTLTPDQLFDRELTPDTSATIRTLAEQSRLTIGLPAVKELPWLKPSRPSPNTTVVADPDRDFVPEGQSFVRSDTGELTRDWEQGIQMIDSPKTQAVSGWVGGKVLKTRDATFQLRTNKAVVALSSVDNQPLNESRFIMITAMARVLATPGGRMPFFSEPVEGAVTIRVKPDNWELLALNRQGLVAETSTPERSGDTVTVHLPVNNATHWLVLRVAAKTDAPASAGQKDARSPSQN